MAILPLAEFPQSMREEIERLVALDEPPPKWKGLGPSDDVRSLAQILSRAWYEWHLARGHGPRRDGTLTTDVSPPRRQWRRLSPLLRPIVLIRDGYTCQKCGANETTAKLHIDHIVSLANGGTHDLDNLQVLCQPCNQRKWKH